MKRLLFAVLIVLALPFAASAADDDYVIGDGDGLQIGVWGVPEMSVAVTVRPDGKITLPAAGDVTAAGFTPPQLATKLSERLSEFVKKPIVTVTVTGMTNSKIYVIGGGVASGVYSLPGRTTLMKFLSRFGNFNTADLEHAYIVRDGKKLDVNFTKLLVKGDFASDIPLMSEDIIFIPDNELKKIYVMGAVATPKYVFYRENIRILDAILEAGGFTKFAKENSVIVQRKTPQGMQEIPVKVKDLMKDGDLSQNIPLQPGDFVIVKEGIF
jgi:polysaccharide export outer membrane protein